MSGPDAEPGRDHILIVGPSKTGTTALYSTLKHSLLAAGHRYITVFEPNRADIFDNLYLRAPNRPVLTKTTVDRVWRIVPDPLVFDRRLTTVRDPRDTLISALLFRPLTKSALERTDEAGMRRFIDSVRQKEEDPSSISVIELFALARRVGIGTPPYRSMVRNLRLQRELIDRHGFHVARYEDFVAHEHDALAEYLGVEIVDTAAGTSATYGHIARSKEPGAFRDWFRKDDLERYDRMFGEFIDAFGYPRDVTLPDQPVLDPAVGSEYLTDRYDNRRKKLRRAASARADVSFAAVESSAELKDLIDHAGDGDAKVCLRLARAYRRGDLGEPDLEQSLVWARRAAQFGLRDGVRATIEILEELDPREAALRRELRAWQAARDAQDAKAGRIDALEARLVQQQRSARMRVGTLVVDAVADPRRRAVPAAREIVALWRARRRRRKATGRLNAE